MMPDFSMLLGDGGVLAPLRTLVEAGGAVVTLLLAMSVVTLALVLAKATQFAMLRVGNTRDVAAGLAAYRAGNPRQALAILAASRNPAAQVAAGAIRELPAAGSRTDLLREEIGRRAAAQIEALRSHLRTIEVVATLSPLLGLFGTVLGMIDAFRAMEAAGSRVDPAVLSGGIWEALLTTAVGLAVAVPSVAAVNHFDRRVEQVTHLMEDAVTQVFTASVAPERSSETGNATAQPAAAARA
jgi:biopolymer transport protein ExbB